MIPDNTETPDNGRRGPRPSKTRSFPNQLRRLRWNYRDENGVGGLTLKELATKVSTDACPVYWQHLSSAERTGKGLNRCAWYALSTFFCVSPQSIETPDPVADFYHAQPAKRKRNRAPP